MGGMSIDIYIYRYNGTEINANKNKQNEWIFVCASVYTPNMIIVVVLRLLGEEAACLFTSWLQAKSFTLYFKTLFSSLFAFVFQYEAA